MWMWKSVSSLVGFLQCFFMCKMKKGEGRNMNGVKTEQTVPLPLPHKNTMENYTQDQSFKSLQTQKEI